MPQSESWAIPWVLEICCHLAPRSVLDVGVGMGEYGFLLRQKIDIGNGALDPEAWQMQIDGIEIFPKYANPLWDYYYDRVTLGDCRKILPTLTSRYDLILLNDIIEHFSRSEALELLNHVQGLGASVLVTTPLGEYPQGPEYGNPAESHYSTWYPADFERLGAVTCTIHRTFLALFTQDDAVARRVLALPHLAYSATEPPCIGTRLRSLARRLLCSRAF